MNSKKLKIGSAIVALALLISLLVKLAYVPGGMILSSLFLGCMEIGGIIYLCLIVSFLLVRYFKNIPLLTILSITCSIGFIIFHYQLFSPMLTIVVPYNYSGEVHLVLSNSKENILTIDTNGIGYITKRTFEKTYVKPKVVQPDGTDISDRCVGFNTSAFWAEGEFCCINNQQFKALSFGIKSPGKRDEARHNSITVVDKVDRTLVLLSSPGQ